MRRSSSTRSIRPLVVAAALLVVPATLGATETLEASLATELELARGSEIYLVLDVETGRLEIRSRGLTLDGVEVRRLGVRSWSSLLDPDRTLDAALPAAVTITRSAPQRRRIVLAGDAVGTASEDSEPSPGLSTIAVDGRFACLLDNGWLLEVRDRADRDSFWRSFWQQLARPFGARVDARRQYPTLVLEMETEDVERLRHLFRRDRAILVR